MNQQESTDPIRTTKMSVAKAVICIIAISTLPLISFGQTPAVPNAPQSLTARDSVSVSINTPDVKAGDTLIVHVELDQPPNVPRGYINVGATGPGPVGAAGSLATAPDNKVYDVSIPIPPDAPGGTWYVTSITVGSVSGMHSSQLKFERQEFHVTQDSTFSLPSEAKVTISLSQTQLLRREAMKLQEKIQTLKADLSALSASKGDGQLHRLLRENVQEADEALKATEKEFIALLQAPSQRPAADIFFSDLDLTYQRALTELKALSTGDQVTLEVKFPQRPQYPVMAEGVFRAFEQNELAYNLVADTGALTFDLDVKSIPVGAQVSYGRRGDSSFQHLQDETNSTIKGLPFAIWLVRFEKPDYPKQEREHNPYVEKNHVVVVDLGSESKKLGK